MNTKILHNVFIATANEILDGRYRESIQDLGLVGSLSGHYGWHDTRLADLDIWTLMPSFSNIGDIVKIFADLYKTLLKHHYPDSIILSEAVDGPYKPSLTSDRSSIVFLHVLPDTLATYRNRSPFTRYAWRKYPTLVTPDVLKRLAPTQPPSMTELRAGRWGTRDLKAQIQSSQVVYTHWRGSDSFSIRYEMGTPQFSEFCIYSILTTARNACRSLGRDEGDRLNNEEFANFIHARTTCTSVLEAVYAKSQSRRHGHDTLDAKELRALALAWLEEIWTIVPMLG